MISSREQSENPYEVLGIDRSASQADVKKAYFGLVKKFTPEKEAEAFKRIRSAYDRLKESKGRVEEDLFLFEDPEGDFTFLEPECALPDMTQILAALARSYSDLDETDFSRDMMEM